MNTERARWLSLGGSDASAVNKALDDAATHFEFAGHQLLGQQLNDVEFRMRRAEFHRLKADMKGGTAEDTKAQLADLDHITREENESYVPRYVWIAHAGALRRLAQAGLWQQQGPARTQAAKYAEAAWKKAKKGAAYREAEFTRADWLEFVNVAWVRSLYLSGAQELASTASMMRWWSGKDLAAKLPASPLEVRGLKAAEAMATMTEGLHKYRTNNAEGAQAAFAAAAELAKEAIQQQAADAAAGGLKPSPVPHRVLGFALLLQKDETRANAAFAKMREFAKINPD